jgi:hypothetical protein
MPVGTPGQLSGPEAEGSLGAVNPSPESGGGHSCLMRASCLLQRFPFVCPACSFGNYVELERCGEGGRQQPEVRDSVVPSWWFTPSHLRHPPDSCVASRELLAYKPIGSRARTCTLFQPPTSILFARFRCSESKQPAAPYLVHQQPENRPI